MGMTRPISLSAVLIDSHKAVMRHLIEELRTHPRLRGGRLGAIDLKQMFDTVLLVLLDADYNASQIYDTARPAVEALLTRPGSKARNERGSVGISQFKAISSLRWERKGS